MKKLLCACAVVAAVFTVSNLQAGERQFGEIPESQLQAMGLGNMQIVSDIEASTVRGKFSLPRTINIKFPKTPKGFVNVFIQPIPFPIFFPEKFIGILAR